MNQKDNHQRYKTCRAFSITDRSVLIRFGVVVWCITLMLLRTRPRLAGQLVVLALGLICIWNCLKKQKRIEIGEGTVSYQEKMHFWIFSALFVRSANVQFVISDVIRIELKQTRFESFFNVGRLLVEGSTDFVTKEKFMDRVPDRDKHIVYGIRNFSKFRQDCQKRFFELMCITGDGSLCPK